MDFFWSVVSLVAVIGPAAATVHLLLRYRDPALAVSWLFALWVLPFLGVLTYLTFSIYDGPRKVRRRKRLSRRLRSAAQRAPRRISQQSGEATAQLESVARRIGALPTTVGNRVVLHGSAAEARADLLEVLRSARTEILLETYIFERDAFSDEVVDILAQQIAAGVVVRVLVDAIGSRRMLSRNLLRLRIQEIPHALFLEPNPFKGRFQINARNHRKILAVDRERAIIGGRNIAAGYFDDGPKGIRDTTVRIDGPAVSVLAGVFLEDWIVATEESPDILRTIESSEPVGNTDVRVVPHGCDEEHDVFVPLVSAAVRSARERILIVTPYFVPDAAVLHDLRQAALSGVHVRVLIPRRSPEIWPDLGARRFFEPLLRAGVEIWRREAPFIHSKAIVIDGQRSFVGSANFDQRSFNLNYELTCEVNDVEFARQLEAHFEPDFLCSTRVDLTTFSARPWHARVVENFVALFSPIL